MTLIRVGEARGAVSVLVAHGHRRPAASGSCGASCAPTPPSCSRATSSSRPTCWPSSPRNCGKDGPGWTPLRPSHHRRARRTTPSSPTTSPSTTWSSTRCRRGADVATAARRAWTSAGSMKPALDPERRATPLARARHRDLAVPHEHPVLPGSRTAAASTSAPSTASSSTRSLCAMLAGLTGDPVSHVHAGANSRLGSRFRRDMPKELFFHAASANTLTPASSSSPGNGVRRRSNAWPQRWE